MVNRFNIRVYGILIQSGQVLLSEEKYQGRNLLKFPGGGVEYGEGIKNALIREYAEELQTEVFVEDLFYVTDYFIQSAFIPTDQIVSFYYLIKAPHVGAATYTEHNLHWMDLLPQNNTPLTFPQDKEVFRLLCEKYNGTHLG